MANVLQKVTELYHVIDARSGATLGLTVAMLLISKQKYQQVDNIEWYFPVCMKQNATIQRQEDYSIGIEAQRQESSLSPDAAFKLPKRGFSLFHLNTHNLFPKINKIRLFEKNNPFNVLVFSGTWLSESVSNSEISIQVYSDPISFDRQYGEHGGGGATVYFKSSVLCKEICSISCPELEAAAIKVCPQNSPSFILVVAYRPDLKTAIEPFFPNILEKFSTMQTKTTIFLNGTS